MRLLPSEKPCRYVTSYRGPWLRLKWLCHWVSMPCSLDVNTGLPSGAPKLVTSSTFRFQAVPEARSVVRRSLQHLADNASENRHDAGSVVRELYAAWVDPEGGFESERIDSNDEPWGRHDGKTTAGSATRGLRLPICPVQFAMQVDPIFAEFAITPERAGFQAFYG